MHFFSMVLCSSTLLIGACGFESGTTSNFPNRNTNGSTFTGEVTATTQRQLFASQPFSNSGQIQTKEGGVINRFFNENTPYSSGNWDFGDSISEQNNNIAQRQAYIFQRGNSRATTSTDHFGLVYSAPNNGALNISSSTAMVLQVGNGRPSTGPNSSAISPSVFTIDLIAKLPGKEVTCSYDLQLSDGDRNFNSTGVNNFGIHTHSIPLTSFDQCDQGGLSEIRPSLSNVAVKVVGGKDTTASQNINSVAMISIGWIAFTSTDSVISDNSTNSNKLFASQIIADSTGTKTLEGGEVNVFSDAAFNIAPDSFGTSTLQIMQNIRKRQAYGIERGHSTAISGDSEFGVTINAPSNNFINASSSSILAIQMGNGSLSTKTYNTYNTLTVVLDNGSAQCAINQNVGNAIPADPLPAGINPYGLRTYEIALNSFTNCGSGATISSVLATLRRIHVKAVTTNNLASASSSVESRTLIHVGWIAFK